MTDAPIPVNETAEPPAPTSRRIEDAAVELFSERGYKSTTVRELALACGLTPGALYNHFPSKDALLYSILREVHEQLDVHLDAGLEGVAGDPAGRMRALVRAHAIFHTRFRKEAGVANEEVLSLEEPGRSELVAIRRRGRRRFEEAIEAGIAAGIFDAADVKVVAMAILNMGIRIAAWFRPGGALSAEQVADLHADLALRMVGVRS
jgi:AcrR family transcriptional regulator